MVKPNFIPRTLTGVGGKRYFDIPGVVYPKEVLKVKPGCSPKSGLPYTKPPSWGITTEQAAEILGSSASAARIMLRRRRVTFQLVSRNNRPPIVFWHVEAVKKLALSKPPLISLDETSTLKLLTTEQAANLLKVGRSTIQRAMKAGKLRPVMVRIPSAQGARKRCYLKRSDILKLLRTRYAKLKQGLEEINDDAQEAENELGAEL